MFVSARNQIFSSNLTEKGVARVIASVLPRRNNFGDINYSELLGEATYFDVRTFGALRKLLLKHRKQILQIDREPLDDLQAKIYSSFMGEAKVRDLLRRQLWYSWEALMRIALELEFGTRYEAFANLRDTEEAN
jgi:hypothetical protein